MSNIEFVEMVRVWSADRSEVVATVAVALNDPTVERPASYTAGHNARQLEEPV